MMTTSSNPTLGAFNQVGALGVSYQDNQTMTVSGTINKTGLLAIILAIAFAFTWTGLSRTGAAPSLPLLIGVIGGGVLGLIISFAPKTAPYLSPIYAGVEGVVLGAISLYFEHLYSNIVMQAAGLTILTVFGMLFAYRTGIIKVNNTFRAVVVGATLAIGVFYLIGMVCLMFGITIPGIGVQYSWLSIGITAVIAIVAALNLALDFDLIASYSGTAPKYMEWYGAFSLMVTVIWLYITLLRLLASLRGRN
jgi:uncharacterized YccA/Bax inhibitor family protein